MAGTDRKISSMKKCSHTAHESLTELNITPLLDLAFVLLVIFIITTIPPVKDMDLKLPSAAKHEKIRPARRITFRCKPMASCSTREDAKMEDLLGKSQPAR